MLMRLNFLIFPVKSMKKMLRLKLLRRMKEVKLRKERLKKRSLFSLS